MTVTNYLPVYLLSFIATYKFILYSPYFIIGLVLFNHQKILRAITSHSVVWAALVTVVYTGLELFNAVYNPESEAFIVRNIFRELEILFSLLMAEVVLVIGYTYFNKKSILVKNLSDAAYTIYILHQPLLLLIVLLSFHQILLYNSYVLYSILSLFVVTVTYLAHIYIVKPSRVLSFLLNGKD